MLFIERTQSTLTVERTTQPLGEYLSSFSITWSAAVVVRHKTGTRRQELLSSGGNFRASRGYSRTQGWSKQISESCNGLQTIEIEHDPVRQLNAVAHLFKDVRSSLTPNADIVLLEANDSTG